MPKFSVKKPYTVLVAVIMVIVLGVVSVTSMTTDLLPTLSLPYLMVLATYPGASPEKVETELTAPLEASLGTVNGVENVTSTSSENFAMVMLEFAEDTDMDSAMVKTSTALNQLAGVLPEGAGTPTLMEVSMDMMATQYVAVSVEGMDIFQLSDYVKEHVVPELERVNGVANVSTSGLVEQVVEVTLQQDMIDEVNDKLLVQVSDKLDDAKKELDKAKREMDKAQAELDKGKKELSDQKKGIDEMVADAIKNIDDAIPGVVKQIADLEGTLNNTQSQLGNVEGQINQLKGQISDRLRELNMGINTGLQELVAIQNTDTTVQANLSLIDEYDARKGQIRDRKDEITDRQGEITAQIEAIDAQPSTLELEAERAALVREQSDLTAEETELDSENAELDNSIAETQNSLREDLGLDNSATQVEIKQRAELLHSQRPQVDAIVDMMRQLEQLTSQADELRKVLDRTTTMLAAARGSLAQLNTRRAELQTAAQGLVDNPLDPNMGQMASMLLFSGMDAQLGLGEFQLSSGKAQVDAALEQYESAREEALKSANLDQLLNMKTLAGILQAQNFSMPAGYISDAEGNQILLKVGNTFGSMEELGGVLLVSMDGVGDVRLSDVATIVMTDNADDSYASVNGQDMVLLSIYKSSTASTSEVSNACLKRMDQMMETNEGLSLITLMDQGDYIRLIVQSVVSNLVWGAALAMLVLALFLRDIRPTLVVAISMPLSVMLALVCMYFTGVTLNMISLSGLALGVGMLVDNSVVVIENIYRLRNRGVPAARASVQGTRQVAGAIVSSTLTTICVFAPLLFATGIVRQLMSDMGLTIAYALTASLIVAMTVVPCAGSTVLKKQKESKPGLFDKLLNVYGKFLDWCLRIKLIPLAVAIGLLAFTVVAVLNTGIVLMPDTGSTQLMASMHLPEDTDKYDAFAAADAVLEAMRKVDGVDSVGAMTSDSLGSIMGMGMGGGGDVDFTDYTFYLILTDEGARDMEGMTEKLKAAANATGNKVNFSSASSMDMSALSGSGLEVEIRGQNLDTLLEISHQVEDLMNQIEGVKNVSNGQEEGDSVVKVVVNKDLAMRYGLTTAQVFMELSAALQDSTTSTTLDVGDNSYTVKIIDDSGVPDLDSIFNYEFSTTTMDENGQQVKETHTLGEFANRQNEEGVASIRRENQARTMTVSSSTEAGYNTTLMARELKTLLAQQTWPAGYTVEIGGESTQVNDMLVQMGKMMALALLMIYFVMVAQFQSLLSPFIVLFTIPLAFTGGMIGLLISGEPMSVVSLMGFLVLMGVIVNNGIVFVDYTNQLRIGGMSRRAALVTTGKTRMRPILMTTLTTVLSMCVMLVSKDAGSEMGKSMAIVVVGGLMYATLMTLIIVPIMYDILFRREPQNIDVGDEGMDDLPDDAAEFLAQMAAAEEREPDGNPEEYLYEEAEEAAEEAEPEATETEETPQAEPTFAEQEPAKPAARQVRRLQPMGAEQAPAVSEEDFLAALTEFPSEGGEQ